MDSDHEEFEEECRVNAANMALSASLRKASIDWMCATAPYRYSYNFRWLGLPIIQLPADLVALQEIVWRVNPEVILETGIARGGSLVFYASLLELLGGDGFVVGVDIDIRPHNRTAIEEHPLAQRIRLIEGSSLDPGVLTTIDELVRDVSRCLVILDSDHTHAHVLGELRRYSRFVTVGSYLVVLDTIVDEMPKSLFPKRSWGPGNNPGSAVREFIAENDAFEVDLELENKLLISSAPGGYLRRIR